MLMLKEKTENWNLMVLVPVAQDFFNTIVCMQLIEQWLEIIILEWNLTEKEIKSMMVEKFCIFNISNL